MRYVSQKHSNGCGVATLAMATGIGYDKAMKMIAPKRKAGSKFRGVTLEEVLKALVKMNVNYHIHFDVSNLGQIKNNAYISASLPCGCRHAVAWDAENKQILDPISTPDPRDHNGKKIAFTRQYLKKNANYIVEIIPS